MKIQFNAWKKTLGAGSDEIRRVYVTAENGEEVGYWQRVDKDTLLRSAKNGEVKWVGDALTEWQILAAVVEVAHPISLSLTAQDKACAYDLVYHMEGVAGIRPWFFGNTEKKLAKKIEKMQSAAVYSL